MPEDFFGTQTELPAFQLPLALSVVANLPV